MKTIEIKYFLFSCLVLACAMCKAQTSNIGELTISPGTVVSTLGVLDNGLSGDFINDGDLYVYGDFNNDGLVGFTPGFKTGITRMAGVLDFQNISGSVPMQWYNSQFNNATLQPAFHLYNEIKISGQADFKEGIVDADTYGGLVVFDRTSSHINADNDSHVQGEVRKIGNEAFVFPIGNGGFYRYAGISSPNNTTDAFTGKYFFESSNTAFPHSSKEGAITLIDNKEYWMIEKSTGNSKVFLTLSWDEGTTPAEIYNTPYDDLHIVHWDDAKKIWIDLGGAADPTTKEVVMIIDPLNEYGVFTLARVTSDYSAKNINVFTAVSPNGDGLNDFLKIDGIDNYKNTVEIYNRWGVRVFETSAYNTSGNVFKGISDNNTTISKGEKLPIGTYFYVINVQNNDGKNAKKSGYLYITY